MIPVRVDWLPIAPGGNKSQPRALSDSDTCAASASAVNGKDLALQKFPQVAVGQFLSADLWEDAR